MIDGRCSLLHPNIENGATSLVPLNIIGSTKRLSQHLKYFLWLNLFKFLAELIIHGGSHYTTNNGMVAELLQVSVSNHATSVRSGLLRCRIYNHKSWYQLSKFDRFNFSLSHSNRSDKFEAISTHTRKN